MGHIPEDLPFGFFAHVVRSAAHPSARLPALALPRVVPRESLGSLSSLPHSHSVLEERLLTVSFVFLSCLRNRSSPCLLSQYISDL